MSATSATTPSSSSGSALVGFWKDLLGDNHAATKSFQLIQDNPRSPAQPRSLKKLALSQQHPLHELLLDSRSQALLEQAEQQRWASAPSTTTTAAAAAAAASRWESTPIMTIPEAPTTTTTSSTCTVSSVRVPAAYHSPRFTRKHTNHHKQNDALRKPQRTMSGDNEEIIVSKEPTSSTTTTTSTATPTTTTTPTPPTRKPAGASPKMPLRKASLNSDTTKEWIQTIRQRRQDAIVLEAVEEQQQQKHVAASTA